MYEILIISGKGGTGKTSLAAAFAHAAEQSVICDLDVDAPDLHLILSPDSRTTHDFSAGHEAEIMADHCNGCGICLQLCQYDAIRNHGARLAVDALKCEGCKVCVELCPNHAIAFSPKQSGRWFESKTRFGPMVHAQLYPGEENSGRLVALLRQRAKTIANEENLGLILSDGPPGIGCPVISAVSGVDLTVIVTEPTPSGRHDLERVISLCEHFGVPGRVILNKCDLNQRLAEEMEFFCRQRSYPIVARLPHDPVFVHAMLQNRSVTEFTEDRTTQRIRYAWEQIMTDVKASVRTLPTAETSTKKIDLQWREMN